MPNSGRMRFNMPVAALVAVAVVVLSTAGCSASRTMSYQFRVVDAESKLALPGVRVQWVAEPTQVGDGVKHFPPAVTDGTGEAVIRNAPWDHSNLFTFSREGYRDGYATTIPFSNQVSVASPAEPGGSSIIGRVSVADGTVEVPLTREAPEAH